MLVDFYINIVAGIVGAGILYLFQKAYFLFVEKRSPLTGVWYATYKNHLSKDDFIVRQRGNNLGGRIKRQFPPNEAHREWIFKGRMEGQQIFVIFWPRNDSSLNCGSAYLLQINEDEFVGYVLTYRPDLFQLDTGDRNADIITPMEMHLKRYRFH